MEKLNETYFEKCRHSSRQLPSILPRNVEHYPPPKELDKKCCACDHADFEKVATLSWTRYYTAKGKIEEDTEKIRKYQRLVDDGKRPPTSGNATLALERGKTEMENLDDVRKCELEQIWAPFNVMWGYDPAQGSEFLGRRATKYVADEDKDGHGVQENRKSSRRSPKRSSKGPQSHPPSGTSSRSRR